MQDAFDQIYRQTSGMADGCGLPLPHNNAAQPDFIRPSAALEELFADDQMLLFQKRTALFLRRSFPAFAKTLTKAELEKLAGFVQQQALARGFATEKQIWHYLIAQIYCGFFFEQDSQYADMLSLIGWGLEPGDKMALLDRLLDIIDEYARECEKDFADFGKKLRYIAGFYGSPQFSSQKLEFLPPPERLALGEELARTVFPARAALWSNETGSKIIAVNLEHAGRLGFSVKDGLFYALAAIYFGRAFEQSPLYPWAYFLQNRDIPPAERGRHFIGLTQRHFAQLAAG